MTAATETESWLPTKDAAALLGVSVRELQRKVAVYPRQLRRRQQRDGRKTVALYHAGDLEVFHRNALDGLDAAVKELTLCGLGSPARRSPNEVSQTALALRPPPADPLAEPPPQEPPAIMSISEAVTAYGIPYAWLRERCQAGVIGMNVGTAKRQIWRISRQQIEEYFYTRP